MTTPFNPAALEGCRRLVFDGHDWEKTGDIGDNSCFWKPATVIKVRHAGEWVADVVFDHKTGLSRGHFVDALREIPSTRTTAGREG